MSLGFLTGEGASVTGPYGNTNDTALFVRSQEPSYIGGILEHANRRLYGNWGNLGGELRTGRAQGEAKSGSGALLFQELYGNPERLEEFLRAMTGVQMGAFAAFTEKFDFAPYKSVCDVGGASGTLSIMLAGAHKHLALTSFDLPQVLPIASRKVKEAGLGDRVTTVSGDFFATPLPKADVIVMGRRAPRSLTSERTRTRSRPSKPREEHPAETDLRAAAFATRMTSTTLTA